MQRNWKHYLWHERNARLSTLQWIETGNESQFSAQLLLLSNDAVVVRLHGSVFQPRFLLVVFNMLSAKHETYNALVAVWCGRTEHAAYHENLTRHSLSAHS